MKETWTTEAKPRTRTTADGLSVVVLGNQSRVPDHPWSRRLVNRVVMSPMASKSWLWGVRRAPVHDLRFVRTFLVPSFGLAAGCLHEIQARCRNHSRRGSIANRASSWLARVLHGPSLLEAAARRATVVVDWHCLDTRAMKGETRCVAPFVML